MRRLYYIADDLQTTRRVSDAIHAEGISDHDFHVVSRDEAGLYTHRIHSATTYQQLDVIHTGERWALGGGVIAAIVVIVLYLGSPWGFRPDLLSGMALILLGGLFGAWQGGMIGMSRENYKLAPFHHDLEAGRYLIMVDVPRDREADVREALRLRFPALRPAGEDSTLINPFESPPKIYPQNTH